MGSFRFRMVFAMALLLGATAAFIQLYFPTSFRAQAESGLAERAAGIASLTASTLGPALDFDDGDAAERRLGELSAVPDVEAAVLLGADGLPFARWSRSARALVSLFPPPMQGFTAGRDFFVSRLNVEGRALHGELVVVLSTAALARQQAQASKEIFGASSAVLVLGLLAVFVVMTLLLRPVRRVTRAAGRISQGDASALTELDLGRTDELGVMARALRDMVGRLLQQSALLESQSEHSSEGFIVASPNGALLSHNRRFRELFGLTREALSSCLLPEVLGRLDALCERPNELLGAPADHGSAHQAPFRLRDGRTLIASRAPICDAGGAVFACAHYFRDVSELRAAQDQLVLADRRSSVGGLAAGVAHEVNNPLTFILANLQFVEDELRHCAAGEPLDADTLIGALADCKEGAERVAYIVRSLTALSRGEEGEHEQVDLIECVKKTLAMAAPELRHRAQVVTRFDLPYAVLQANSVRLGQVFLNLLINAGKAVGAEGVNTIEVVIARGPGETVEVSVRDTGCGMNEQVLARLFQPFFTTRDVGSGTGLGLSVSLSIVQSYGGTITVQSAVGSGSTFTVRLPLSSRQLIDHKPLTDEERPLRRLRLLIVDDEAQVTTSLQRTLEAWHDVTVCTGGAAALERLASGETFDVMLTDLHMPGINGPSLFGEVARLHPRLAARTLFMSGGAVTQDISDFAQLHRAQLMPKPIEARRLRVALAGLSLSESADA